LPNVIFAPAQQSVGAVDSAGVLVGKVCRLVCSEGGNNFGRSSLEFTGTAVSIANLTFEVDSPAK